MDLLPAKEFSTISASDALLLLPLLPPHLLHMVSVPLRVIND